MLVLQFQVKVDKVNRCYSRSLSTCCRKMFGNRNNSIEKIEVFYSVFPTAAAAAVAAGKGNEQIYQKFILIECSGNGVI